MFRLAPFLIVPLAVAIATFARGDSGGQGNSQPGRHVRSYQNPVLPGDYPDPSVIRVGQEYRATATTSQWAPIFPLLRSTDAFSVSADGRNWRKIDADADGGYLPPWDLAVRVALVVAGGPGASARFGAFTLSGE